MIINLRPLDLQTDAPRYAELLSTVYPEPVTVDKVYEWESHFPKDGVRHRQVALNERGQIVGYNHCARMPHMLPQSYGVEVAVFPEFQRRGVGARLYDDAQTFARSQGATRLEAKVRDHQPAGLG